MISNAKRRFETKDAMSDMMEASYSNSMAASCALELLHEVQESIQHLQKIVIYSTDSQMLDYANNAIQAHNKEAEFLVKWLQENY